MSIIGLSLEATRPYQSRLDPAKGTDEATVFRLGTLDSRIMGKIRDLATTINVDPSQPDDEVETSINQNEVFFQTVSYGLKGWEKFKDKNGNDIEFATITRRHSGQVYQIVDPDKLKLLPQSIIVELAQEIQKDNEVSNAQGNA